MTFEDFELAIVSQFADINAERVARDKLARLV